MPIDYSKLFSLMKQHKLTSYKIRKNKVIAETALQNIRQGNHISMETVEKLCAALNCQPGDILSYIPDEEIENEKTETEK